MRVILPARAPATGSRLHMVRPFGFEISDKYLKRAGLDYWHLVDISYYDSFDELREKFPASRFFYFTTKGRRRHSDETFRDGDFLVFGKETKGLPEELLLRHPGECLRIPMFSEARSLNLSIPWPWRCMSASADGLRGLDGQGRTARAYLGGERKKIVLFFLL